MQRGEVLEQAVSSERRFLRATGSFQDRPHQQSQQGDEDQAFNPLVAAHEKGAHQQRAFDGAEAFFHPILAFEHGQGFVGFQMSGVSRQGVASIQLLSRSQLLLIDVKVEL